MVSPEDFAFDDAGPLDPREVLRDPTYTLYCFDFDGSRALFAQCPNQKAVDRAAFFYQAQAEKATAFATMPFSNFLDLAATIPEPRGGLVLVHSTGRCGSTLVSKVLASVRDVHSLSEPDEFTQIARLYAAGEASAEWCEQALAGSARWRCKPRLGPPAHRVCLKTRSEVLVMADSLARLFPNAKHLFLYRDGIAWIKSVMQAFPHERDFFDADLNRELESAWARALPTMRDYIDPGSPLNPVQVRIFGWITCMEAYFKLAKSRVSLLPIRYEDLLARPTAACEDIFRFCEIADVDWDAVREVLSRDSQEGTSFGRAERGRNPYILSEEQIQYAREVIAARPLLQTPDVVLGPGHGYSAI